MSSTIAAKSPPANRKLKNRGHRKDLALAVDSIFDPSDLKDSRLYLNRELSLLAFQRRVLEEAVDPDNRCWNG